MPAMKSYRAWSPDQPFLMPPNPGEWLPEDHVARFVLELVRELDITAIETTIQSKDPRGERPYMSSRKIERKTYEDVAFRYLAGGQNPEFSTICTFRRTHLAAVEDLFGQVVRLAREAAARETRAAQLREQAERARELAVSSDDPAERERASRRAERREAAADALAGDGGENPSGSDSGSVGGPLGITEPTGTKTEKRRVGELPVHHPKVTRDGTPQARGEWGLVCMCHNVRRLHAATRWGRSMQAGQDDGPRLADP